MMKPISRFDTIAQMRSQIKLWRGQGLSIGLVPTMGNLHRGHIALIETALGSADRVITTIFPNPTQFGEGEDFAAYPRSEQGDIDQITQIGGHGVFIPPVAEVYPPDFATKISVEGLGDCLCGANRPHHFGGVALIVAKLLNQARPDIVVFGQKDWQQLLIIRRLVRDLDLDVQVVSVPTVRDKAGLALSSRNGYLSAEQLDVARQFNRGASRGGFGRLSVALRPLRLAIRQRRICWISGLIRWIIWNAEMVRVWFCWTGWTGNQQRGFLVRFIWLGRG